MNSLKLNTTLIALVGGKTIRCKNIEQGLVLCAYILSLPTTLGPANLGGRAACLNNNGLYGCSNGGLGAFCKLTKIIV